MFGRKQEEEPYDPTHEEVTYSDNFGVWDYYGYWNTEKDLLKFLEYMKDKGFSPICGIAESKVLFEKK